MQRFTVGTFESHIRNGLCEEDFLLFPVLEKDFLFIGIQEIQHASADAVDGIQGESDTSRRIIALDSLHEPYSAFLNKVHRHRLLQAILDGLLEDKRLVILDQTLARVDLLFLFVFFPKCLLFLPAEQGHTGQAGFVFFEHNNGYSMSMGFREIDLPSYLC